MWRRLDLGLNFGNQAIGKLSVGLTFYDQLDAFRRESIFSICFVLLIQIHAHEVGVFLYSNIGHRDIDQSAEIGKDRASNCIFIYPR